jgi:hypothetical protein
MKTFLFLFETSKAIKISFINDVTKYSHFKVTQNLRYHGTQYITGENLKVVWSKFSTLSQAV